jgi:hypothetical protein
LPPLPSVVKVISTDNKIAKVVQDHYHVMPLRFGTVPDIRKSLAGMVKKKKNNPNATSSISTTIHQQHKSSTEVVIFLQADANRW